VDRVDQRGKAEVIRKLLIANRGEIACRIARTARRLGIATVAIYSDADANSLHVRSCDETVRIGPAPARESYLKIDAVLLAARQTGADAIHPGYGFLSENAAFAEACARAGLLFVGPTPAAIRAMGSKSEAKALMERAGVPLVPGYHGVEQDEALLAREAARIGYPVLIKASAGGGGKGMRIVHAAAEFAKQLAACRREAAASFGDDRVLIERYVVRPRHIEFQVFGDTHGNCIHLLERDCSVQRRHQKVLEEAPAPGMTSLLREKMGAAAVAAARAVNYLGAGTIEFIVGPDWSFYFMEMNTRLQVEHPVTEFITGFDLVEWQLRVAAGEPLPVAQSDITARGHAIEARVYAEDPARGFLPSIGTLLHHAPPATNDSVRVDTGVEQGDEIAAHYDPMIAKLIVWGADREAARHRLRDALRRYRVVGPSTNLEFLARLVDTPSFAKPELDTGLIEREGAGLLAAASESTPELDLLATFARIDRERAIALRASARQGAAGSPWARTDAWRMNLPAERKILWARAGGAKAITIMSGPADGICTMRIDGSSYRVSGAVHWSGESLRTATIRAQIDGAAFDATVVLDDQGRWHLFTGFARAILSPPARVRRAAEDTDGAAHLRAPMPGRIIRVLVEPGVSVARGAPLIVVEAMKMEHTVVAPVAGRVSSVHFATGDTVKEGADLIELVPSE
jgi:3-methylcrotonyl-CoA carboxylase alpha subunit